MSSEFQVRNLGVLCCRWLGAETIERCRQVAGDLRRLPRLNVSTLHEVEQFAIAHQTDAR